MCPRRRSACCNPHTQPDDDEGALQLSEVDYEDFAGEESE